MDDMGLVIALTVSIIVGIALIFVIPLCAHKKIKYYLGDSVTDGGSVALAFFLYCMNFAIGMLVYTIIFEGGFSCVEEERVVILIMAVLVILQILVIMGRIRKFKKMLPHKNPVFCVLLQITYGWAFFLKAIFVLAFFEVYIVLILCGVSLDVKRFFDSAI